MDRIRCGVIGLGWFGEHHVDTLKQLPQAELTAVCTRRPERLDEVARKYGVPKKYTDYRALLADREETGSAEPAHRFRGASPQVRASRTAPSGPSEPST